MVLMAKTKMQPSYLQAQDVQKRHNTLNKLMVESRNNLDISKILGSLDSRFMTCAETDEERRTRERERETAFQDERKDKKRERRKVFTWIQSHLATSDHHPALSLDEIFELSVDELV